MVDERSNECRRRSPSNVGRCAVVLVLAGEGKGNVQVRSKLRARTWQPVKQGSKNCGQRKNTGATVSVSRLLTHATENARDVENEL